MLILYIYNKPLTIDKIQEKCYGNRYCPTSAAFCIILNLSANAPIKVTSFYVNYVQTGSCQGSGKKALPVC